MVEPESQRDLMQKAGKQHLVRQHAEAPSMQKPQSKLPSRALPGKRVRANLSQVPKRRPYVFTRNAAVTREPHLMRRWPEAVL